MKFYILFNPKDFNNLSLYNSILPEYLHYKGLGTLGHFNAYAKLIVSRRMIQWFHKSIFHVLQIVYFGLNGTLEEAIVHNHGVVCACQHFVHQWIIHKLTAVHVVDLIHYTMGLYRTHNDTQRKARRHLNNTKCMEHILARNFLKIFHKIVITVSFHRLRYNLNSAALRKLEHNTRVLEIQIINNSRPTTSLPSTLKTNRKVYNNQIKCAHIMLLSF